jgi:hypothetical protein
MQSKAYALTTLAGGVGLFATVVSANVILDPYAVFGTGLFARSPNANDRYEHFNAYLANFQRYDGLLFGSSRAGGFDRDELSLRTKGVKFANFSVVGGMLFDYLPVLEFAVREKRARGEPLRAVFLFLDADAFFFRPFTNRSNQYVWPPELTGENRARFWWKNLTAIQFQAWQGTIRNALAHAPAIEPPKAVDEPAHQSAMKAAVFDASPNTAPAHQSALKTAVFDAGPTTAATAAPLVPAGETKAAAGSPVRNEDQVRFTAHFKRFEQFVDLCRANNIHLVVAVSPIHPLYPQYDNPKIEKWIEQISRLVPVWDFTHSTAMTNPDLWVDQVNHFRPIVAHMIIKKIFNDEMPWGWDDFGKLRHP